MIFTKTFGNLQVSMETAGKAATIARIRIDVVCE